MLTLLSLVDWDLVMLCQNTRMHIIVAVVQDILTLLLTNRSVYKQCKIFRLNLPSNNIAFESLGECRLDRTFVDLSLWLLLSSKLLFGSNAMCEQIYKYKHCFWRVKSILRYDYRVYSFHCWQMCGLFIWPSCWFGRTGH